MKHCHKIVGCDLPKSYSYYECTNSDAMHADVFVKLKSEEWRKRKEINNNRSNCNSCKQQQRNNQIVVECLEISNRPI